MVKYIFKYWKKATDQCEGEYVGKALREKLFDAYKSPYSCAHLSG